MFRRISLANKCLLLFGTAVVFIILAALTVPGLRITTIIDEQERSASRQMVGVWEAGLRAQPGASLPESVETSLRNGRIRLLSRAQAVMPGEREPFVDAALDAFNADPQRGEFDRVNWSGWGREYRFARAVRNPGGELVGLIVLERQNPEAARERAVNFVYLLSSGSVALGLAVLVFYLITNKLILSPVRTLQETAEEVRLGNLETRSDIQTGDEFEDLAETFNGMLQALQDGQRNLRAINTALDARLGELQAQTLALHESNRLKGEFLANVSHELRTPMNSILGFADLLLEAAAKEAAAGDDTIRVAKRLRYLENIVSSGKHLLALIEDLLELAKVEAGEMDITLEPVDLPDFAEANLALMRPVADKRGVELRLEVVGSPPPISTDHHKLQQIVFNLLSNAVKFSAPRADPADDDLPPPSPAEGLAAPIGTPRTPRQPLVTLRVEHLLVRAPGDGSATEKVRISVLDTGPGIAKEHHELIFQKFTQLDRGLSRTHEGTGLGLAICKELTHILQGEIHVDSELGQGAMFSVILPVTLDQTRLGELKLEAKFRGSLQARRHAGDRAPAQATPS